MLKMSDISDLYMFLDINVNDGRRLFRWHTSGEGRFRCAANIKDSTRKIALAYNIPGLFAHL
jgi:hypothetical protein